MRSTPTHRVDFPVHCRIFLLERLADIEYGSNLPSVHASIAYSAAACRHRLADGASEELQLSDMIATFQRIRTMAAATVTAN